MLLFVTLEIRAFAKLRIRMILLARKSTRPLLPYEMLDAIATRLPFGEISRRIIGDSCPVINFMSLLPIVECKLPDDARDHYIRHKRPTMWSATTPSRTRHPFLSPSFSLYPHARLNAYPAALEKRIIIRRKTNIGEAEFIVTSDFVVGNMFQRESSPRSHADESASCTRHRASYILEMLRFSESNSRFRRDKPALYFYRWKHKFTNVEKIQPYVSPGRPTRKKYKSSRV